ncbi:epidermal growth factor receptor-like isoform X2 [Artemia franciscana]|uniref:epidermal growth factor receptor-like isoform X2 n=1 Tax=Artemia franciscana TaxID=6661 RepID=UPI0032D9FFDE
MWESETTMCNSYLVPSDRFRPTNHMRIVLLRNCVIFTLVLCILIPACNCAKKDKKEKDISVSFPDIHKEIFRGKICIGTNGRMSVPSNREHHYRNLRDRYTNCTYVDGNLELTWLQDSSLDLSFLQHIREVTGYVLISHVDVKKIALPSLQIIRGRTFFKLSIHEEEFSLMVTLSKTETLEMPALRDILAGYVGLFNNYNLCHIRSINWDEIITGPNAKFMYVYNFTEPERECSCHESCEKGCWGNGPENCQKFSKVNCSPQCHQGRCFGPKPRECCHLFCAGGCTGPKQSDCLACRNFFDDGVCKQECPAMQRYNPITYSWEINPDGKYAYGATCVKNCPEHLLKDNGACVRSCPNKKKAVNGECIPCDGPCPKTCQGVDLVHAGNIASFKDCTIIEGSLTILDHSFSGYQAFYPNMTFGPRHPQMHPDSLEVFSTLKEITGFLNIQAHHPAFRNLSYFRNMEIIGGRTLTEYFSAIYIVKSSLQTLNLKSLRKIRSGSVAVLENKELCLAETINWSKIMESRTHGMLLQNNKPKNDCKIGGFVCHQQCSNSSCWGIGPNYCYSCAHWRLDDTCVDRCDPALGTYESTDKICKRCDEECEFTCSGPGPGNCTSCKHVRDGPYCVSSCPTTKFDDNGECQSCHENCIGGCQGPENNIGMRGCNSCDKAVVDEDMEVERCLKKEEGCPNGYFFEWVGPQEQGPLKPLAGKAICRKCHPRCKKCTAFGFHEQVCQECVRYKRGEQCEDECPVDHYADESKSECVRCAEECRGCVGPLVSDCIACRNYRIYTKGGPGENGTTFNCTANCPQEYPHKIFPDGTGDPYCAKDPVVNHLLSDDHEQLAAIVGGVFGCVFLFGIFLACFGYQWHQRAKSKENTAKMTLVMSGRDDLEPLKPSNVKPNLAKLRIVKEIELRKGGILGYGAFGTVYKGVWVPENDNVKIPVAIKVLREGTATSTANREILDEAYIMASVEHPNLLQLLAVCMTSQMMLVTQLMPLGCLLDYVRNNKDKIGSKPLLNWCTQIARGMAYLEEQRLVHRDLAARNVLVQNPGCVKITDFGLAKLLDINEDEYKAAGGKMPIKWLALECIQHRIFTHKSDVWAFGVTVWEVLTYGCRPYEQYSAREVPDLLERGERLVQPPICTIDVYMLMVKCWMLDAESRPSFKELAEEFAKMARDPGRYLVIPGDKLMRLPSYSPQDEKELIRNLSSAMDGPEIIMDAEEYLTPKARQPLSSTTTMTTNSSETPPPNTPTKKAPSIAGSDFSSAFPESPGPMTDAEKVDGRHFLYPPPPNFLRKGGLCKSVAKVGGEVLNLPVDEDDYLMPSPSGSQQPPLSATAQNGYMDLIGDGKISESESETYKQQRRPVLGMDNPEYHIMSKAEAERYPSSPFSPGSFIYPPSSPYGPAPHSPYGSSQPPISPSSVVLKPMSGPSSISGDRYMRPGSASGPGSLNGPFSVSASISGAFSGPSSTKSVYSSGPGSINVGGGATLGIPVTSPYQLPSGTFGKNPKSPEEELEHEYYNDLQRELQPLTPIKGNRSETTV